jgi:hypothetical protein
MATESVCKAAEQTGRPVGKIDRPSDRFCNLIGETDTPIRITDTPIFRNDTLVGLTDMVFGRTDMAIASSEQVIRLSDTPID